MPHKPKRPCRAQGCRNFCETGESYCAEHLKEQNKSYKKYERDQEIEKFYLSFPWRTLRAQKLRDQPLCEECLRNGIVTAAVMVDHILPIKQGGARLDMMNLQSLCWPCHSRKSIEEGSRFGEKG